MAGKWITVGWIGDIPRLGARVVSSTEGDIAIFRSSNDEIFAVYDRCPHQGGPLSEGIVHGQTVTCPLHNWRIDLKSGDVLGPDEGCARTLPVAVKEGVVRIYIASSATGTDG